MRCRLAAFVVAVWFAGPGCTPEPVPPSLDPPVPAASEDRVHLAGDEAATLLLRHLAEHFSARNAGGGAVVVEAPLGAAGALRAVADGALDAACVLTAEGSPGPEGAVPIAITHAILATGGASSLRSLTQERLRALLLSGPTSESGPALLLAPADDPVQHALAAVDPALEGAFDEAIAQHHWPVYFDGAALRDALRRTPGAVAVVDTGTLRHRAIPLWTVALTESPPPDVRLVLQVVPGPHPPARLQEFLAFITGPDGRALVSDVGYTPP